MALTPSSNPCLAFRLFGSTYGKVHDVKTETEMQLWRVASIGAESHSGNDDHIYIPSSYSKVIVNLFCKHGVLS